MNYVQPIRDKEKIERIKAILRKKSYRNYMLFMTGIYTGLRCSDLRLLQAKHFRDKTHLVLVDKKTKHAKKKSTGKTRRLKINPELKREMNCYICGKPDDEYIFKSRQGGNKPISVSMVYKMLREIGNQVGLQEIGTHTLRKTFGYWFYDKYKRAVMLQEWFGHSSEAITLRYIGINQDIMDKAIDNFKI